MRYHMDYWPRKQQEENKSFFCDSCIISLPCLAGVKHFFHLGHLFSTSICCDLLWYFESVYSISVCMEEDGNAPEREKRNAIKAIF